MKLRVGPQNSNVAEAGDALASSYVADLRQPVSVRSALIDEIAADVQLPHAAVLDVGCADGDTTAAVAAAFPDDQTVGVDISTSMIDRARLVQPPGIRFIVGDFSRLPIESRSARLITAFNMWHLVADRKAALVEARRTLRPGGLLAIVGAFREDLSVQLVHQLFPEFHLAQLAQHQSSGEFITLANSLGFEVVSRRVKDFTLNLGTPEQVVRLIATRPFFGLRTMDDAQFEKGLADFTKRVMSRSGFVMSDSRCTLVTLRPGARLP